MVVKAISILHNMLLKYDRLHGRDPTSFDEDSDEEPDAEPSAYHLNVSRAPMYETDTSFFKLRNKLVTHFKFWKRLERQ